MRRVLVPIDILTNTQGIGAEALRLLLVVAAHADKQGRTFVSNDTVGNLLGIKSRNVQKLMKQAMDCGYLKRQYDVDSGRRYLLVSFDNSGGEPEVHPAHSECASSRTLSTGGGALTVRGVAHSECASPTPPIYEEQSSLTAISNSSSKSESFSGQSETVPFAAAGTKNLEPFESGIANRLPDVRNAVEPFRRRAVELTPTEFPQVLADRITEVLGMNGDKFARKVTQDQADSGFCEWVLKKSETAKNPIGFALHLLKTEWRDGWTNPTAAEDAHYAELVEMMRRIQQ